MFNSTALADAKLLKPTEGSARDTATRRLCFAWITRETAVADEPNDGVAT
jgi:hypothetical protein